METFKKSSKIIDIVNEFPGITQKSISQMTGFNASTVSRHCKNLADDGYLVKVGRRYYIGEKFTEHKEQRRYNE